MRTLNFVPKYMQGLCKMGLNWLATIKLFSFGCCFQKQFVGLNCFDLTKLLCCMLNPINSLVDGHAKMSHMTCHNHLLAH